MNDYMTIGRPAMGDNETNIVRARNHQDAARIAALAILKNAEQDFEDDIYIDIVVDNALCAQVGTVFSADELKEETVTLELGVYGIVITYFLLEMNGCAITSSMKEDSDNPENDAFNAAVDGLESMILGHFSAGVDVCSEAYLEGIETAYTALGVQFS